jgi:hypothetical protein
MNLKMHIGILEIKDGVTAQHQHATFAPDRQVEMIKK